MTHPHCYCSSLDERTCDFCGGTRKLVARVYRNTRFTKRNYDCTNVAACVPLADSAVIPEGYEEADGAILEGMRSLWIEGDIRYFGWN